MNAEEIRQKYRPKIPRFLVAFLTN